MNGTLVYRASVGGRGVREGDIVRVGVRDCPDPGAARLYIEQVFADVVGDTAAVVWEPRRSTPPR